MLTVEECLQLCDLSEEEIHAIAEHEGIPEIVAAELGECLLKTDVGTWIIKRYLMEGIVNAESQGHPEKAQRLKAVLEHFNIAHPTYDLRPRSRSQQG